MEDCTASSTHFRTCGGDSAMQRMQESWVIYIKGNAAMFATLQIRNWIRIRMQAGAFEKNQDRLRESRGALLIRRLIPSNTQAHTHTWSHA